MIAKSGAFCEQVTAADRDVCQRGRASPESCGPDASDRRRPAWAHRVGKRRHGSVDSEVHGVPLPNATCTEASGVPAPAGRVVAIKALAADRRATSLMGNR